MDHQDWSPTVIRNALYAKKSAEHAKKPTMSSEAIRLAKLANNEEGVGVSKRPKVLSVESRQTMMRLRADQTWSQRDLDMRCSFPAHTIRDLENGKLPPSTTQLNIVNRVLKTGLKLE